MNPIQLQDYAWNEVIRLVVSDPAIRRIMAECNLASGHLLSNNRYDDRICQRRARLSVGDSSLGVHIVWSGLLLLRSQSPPSVDKVLQYMQSNYQALRDSLMSV